jgi:hypothetical protein
MIYLLYLSIKTGFYMSAKYILFFAFVFCAGCNAQSELIKPEGEWRRINPVNQVSNQFVDVEKEAKNGR